MSRKDYKKFADMFLEHRNYAIEGASLLLWESMAKGAADIFALDNPSFSRERFYTACGLTPNVSGQAEMGS